MYSLIIIAGKKILSINAKCLPQNPESESGFGADVSTG